MANSHWLAPLLTPDSVAIVGASVKEGSFGETCVRMVGRNGYGRQVHSFEAEIDAQWNGGAQALTATFIRAPRVTRVGSGVEVLARYNNDPVLVRQGHLLAASFHPELNDSTALQEYFLSEVVLAGCQG